MLLCLGQLADFIREGERLDKILELEDALQALDALSFHDFPFRYLR